MVAQGFDPLLRARFAGGVTQIRRAGSARAAARGAMLTYLTGRLPADAPGCNLNQPGNAAIVPSMQPVAEVAADRKLSLAEVLDDLIADGLVARAEADKLIA